MRYVGNASLSESIQERILNTFRQTIDLAQGGSRQEALLGCDFILRLDPLFEPARRLQERLKEGEGPVETGDLAVLAGIAVEPEERAEIDDDTLAPTNPEPPPIALAPHLAGLLEKRNFAELLRLAGDHRDDVAAQDSLREIVAAARSRAEAEPYVDSFLTSARQALDAGDSMTAAAHLAKARELDATHPGVATLSAELNPVEEVAVPIESIHDVSSDDVLAVESAESEEASVAESTQGSDWLDDLGQTPSLDSEPAAQLDSDSERRIEDLLQEGQNAFDSGEYQSAIDSWSRIFLIDIDHEEASRCIEIARKLKAEMERQVEESFHGAIALLEAGDTEAARDAFESLLAGEPNHLGAKEYLEKIASGQLGGEEATFIEVPTTETPTSLPSEAFPGEDLEGFDLAAEELEEATTPSTSIHAGVPEVASPVAPRKRSFALIGTAVLVVVLVLAWLVYSKWDEFFPNAEDQIASAPRPEVDPVERARELHEAGNTAMAINLLRRLPPDHEQYSEAHSLIVMWETGGQPQESTDTQAPSEQDLARFSSLVAEANDAAREGEYLRSAELLDSAAQIAKLDEDNANLRILAGDMLEEISEEIEMFEQGDWEYALPNLWRIHESDPGNRDVIRLIVDSYYNLGLRDLQRGDPQSAAEKLSEAQQLAPGDEEVQRLADFAGAYSKRPSDLLYRIYVKYHPFR